MIVFLEVHCIALREPLDDAAEWTSARGWLSADCRWSLLMEEKKVQAATLSTLRLACVCHDASVVTPPCIQGGRTSKHRARGRQHRRNV